MGFFFFSCSSDLSSVWIQHFLNFNLLLWLGLTTKQKCVSLFYSSDQMKRGSGFYCWKHWEKWSSRYQGAGCTSRNQTPGHFFHVLLWLVERRLCCWDMEPLWGEPGEGGPRWCWKSFREQGWQSAEQRDWHYWCHKAILLSCKIQIFIHYADPSDSDPCPRTTDILYKASAACTRLKKRKAFNQHQMTPTATSSVAKFWSCWQMVEVQGRPLFQRHKHNWNTCCGQLHAKNWGQQGLLACTARLRDALAALWKCFVDLPASEASHRSLYGNWKIGLGPTRESAS